MYLPIKATIQQRKNYVNSVVESNIMGDSTLRKHQRIRSLLKSYSRNISTKASLKTIYEDILAGNDTLSRITVNAYLDDLRSIHLVDELPAWNPNLRSKTTLRVLPTRMLVDPSIAVASLGMSPNDLLNDFHMFGLLFEALCIRDLRVYADALEGEVYYYRDANNLECDAIIHLQMVNGRRLKLNWVSINKMLQQKTLKSLSK